MAQDIFVFKILYTTTKPETKKGVRALRKIIGQIQAEFAAMLGVAKDTVASWETGRRGGRTGTGDPCLCPSNIRVEG